MDNKKMKDIKLYDSDGLYIDKNFWIMVKMLIIIC